MNVTLFHSGKVILVDANVTFSHVVAVNKSVEEGVEEGKKAVDVELYFSTSSEG